MGYVEKERSCQALFASEDSYWHGYTSGKETPALFATDEDFNFVMNVIAQASYVYRNNVKIIAFQVMNNHFHFVVASKEDNVLAFFNFFRKRLSRVFPDAKKLKLYLKPITDLQALRNNIVYTNRNGYVANPDHTPFSYPWGTSSIYYNRSSGGGKLTEKSVRELRIMFRGRDPQLPEDWQYVDNHIAPESFCLVKFGMAMFRDAHHYFSMVSKNVEAYGGVAADIDEEEFLTDTELFVRLSAIMKERYRQLSLRNLSNAQKLDLARTLHYDFRSSNGQLRRVLGLTKYEIDSLFPLSSKE